MMRRILATYIKEWHLMRRDIGGLSLLFIMPAVLVIIMALVQDGPFKDYKHKKFHTLVLDLDQGSVAQQIKEGLHASGQFELIESINNQPLQYAHIKQLIQSGSYPFAIIIKAGVSAEIVNSGNIIATEIAHKIGIQADLPHRSGRDTNNIEVMFDPVSKPAFKMAVTGALEKFIEKIQSQIVLERIAKLSPQNDTSANIDFEKIMHQVSVKEIPSEKQNVVVSKMNSVQHNVPSWAIFGIFFMIIIISESIISERNSGSRTRIRLIPGSMAHILAGKLLFFVILGIIQFYVMLLVGIYVMPLLGLDALYIGHNPAALFIMTSCIALCAASYGILIGILFNSSNQALPVGAISVVILSAIGGVWVPLEVLPKLLQNLSFISPMRWSLQGINNLLLRDGSFAQILLPASVLIGGSLICLVSASLIEKNKKN